AVAISFSHAVHRRSTEALEFYALQTRQAAAFRRDSKPQYPAFPGHRADRGEPAPNPINSLKFRLLVRLSLFFCRSSSQSPEVPKNKAFKHSNWQGSECDQILRCKSYWGMGVSSFG